MKSYELEKTFVENDEMQWQQVDNGVQRKMMAFDDQLMMVKVKFDRGAVGTLHQHPHSQITHIESGVFEVEIQGEKKILKAGDAFYVAPNAVHGVFCLEEGILVDVFSPMRADFL